MRIYKSLLVAISLCSCNSTSTSVANRMGSEQDDSTHLEYVNINRSLRQSLKGASLQDTILEIRDFHFSDLYTKDLFQLKVTPGLIVTSRTEVTISKTNGETIFRQTFPTRYFVESIFSTDTAVPMTQRVEEQYLIRHFKALTKTDIEKKVYSQTRHFFDDIFIDRNDIRELEGQQIIDSTLYKQACTDSTLKIIFLPCFETDMCGNWLVYSRKLGKAIIFLKF